MRGDIEKTDGEAIRRTLCREGVGNQADLAKKTGYGRRQIQKMEAGGTAKLKTIKDFAEAPDVEVGRYILESPLQTNDVDNQNDLFSPGIVHWMASLNRTVQMLTEEQYRVIIRLTDCPRARITGCAGSGKTMVAAEKAARCSAPVPLRFFFVIVHAWRKTFVGMLKETYVKVEDFCDWVHTLAGGARRPRHESWTNYDEPDANLLAEAMDALLGGGARYSVVIVDEGQDFREEMVEDCRVCLMKDPHQYPLYIP